jgi:hypothetical protein
MIIAITRLNHKEARLNKGATPLTSFPEFPEKF